MAVKMRVLRRAELVPTILQMVMKGYEIVNPAVGCSVIPDGDCCLPCLTVFRDGTPRASSWTSLYLVRTRLRK